MNLCLCWVRCNSLHCQGHAVINAKMSLVSVIVINKFSQPFFYKKSKKTIKIIVTRYLSFLLSIKAFKRVKSLMHVKCRSPLLQSASWVPKGGICVVNLDLLQIWSIYYFCLKFKLTCIVKKLADKIIQLSRHKGYELKMVSRVKTE